MKTHLLWLAVCALLLPPLLSDAAENAMVEVKLTQVPVAPDVTAEIIIAWGAESAPSATDQQRVDPKKFRGGRSSSTLELKSQNKALASRVSSYIVYGRLVTNDNKTLGVFPAKLISINPDPTKESLNQLKVELPFRPEFASIFTEGYPLVGRFPSDLSLTSTTVRPVLRSLKELIEFSDENGFEIPKEIWGRIYETFLLNVRFFRQSGETELNTVLIFLRSYTTRSKTPSYVDEFYVDVLTKLVASPDRPLDLDESKSMTDYLLQQMTGVYGRKPRELFTKANLSLKAFYDAKKPEHCIRLATTILAGMDQRLLDEMLTKQEGNVRSILDQVAVCGKSFYAVEDKQKQPVFESAAVWLANSPVGRPMVDEYRKVCAVLEAKKLLTTTFTGDYQWISDYCINFHKAVRTLPGAT